MSQQKQRLSEDQVAEIWALLGPMPVLSTEDQRAYDVLRAADVEIYRPANAYHVKLIRELVDTDWEISRFIRHRTKGIERHFLQQIEMLLSHCRSQSAKNKDRAQYLAEHQSSDTAQLAKVEALVREAEADIEELRNRKPNERAHNTALEHGAAFMDQLDKWLNSATARRNNLLDLLEYHCGRPKVRSQLIETDYEEIEGDKVEHENSPTLPPPEVIANEVAAQNPSEPIQLAKE
jgi:hypothetical protein